MGKIKNCVVEVFSRVTGFYRPVQDWNKGKKAEHSERKHFKGVGSDNFAKGKGDNGDTSKG